MNHTTARAIITSAFFRRFGRNPTRPEAQLVQAIGDLETDYGRGWKPPGTDSHNWGAIQAHSGWRGPTFSYFDTKPQPDGTSKRYEQAFRAYATDEEGASDLIRTVYLADFANTNRDRELVVLPRARAGDTLGFSTGLYDTGYYEGFGRDKAERIRHHHAAVLRSIIEQCHELGEPMPDGSAPPAPPPRMLRLKSPPMVGPDVLELRAFLQGDKPDSYMPDGWRRDDPTFDAGVDTVLREWQASHQLKVDGLFGPASREVAGFDDDIPPTDPAPGNA